MRVSFAFAAAFLATAGLVWAGVFHGVDQHAVSHWMPYLNVRPHHFVTIVGLLLPTTGGPMVKQLLNLWIYPAAFVPSGLIVAWCAWRARSLMWPVLWVAGNGVELAGKLIVSRPGLYENHWRLSSFDHSLPSGHTIRALLLAGVLAWMWRRGRTAYAWALTVPFALVVLGHHAPLDCVAGVFVAGALLALPEASQGRTGRSRFFPSW